jgi:cupin fold WbuC family metalloprotein
MMKVSTSYNLINQYILDKSIILKKIKSLKLKYKISSRILFHKNTKSKLHIMLIKHSKEYLGDPFKFKNTKVKTFLLIKGSAKFIFYNNKGNIINTINFSKKNDFLILDESKYFYNQIIKSKNIIFFEITNGPFVKKDKKFLHKSVKNFPTTKNYLQLETRIKNSLKKFSKI